MDLFNQVFRFVCDAPPAPYSFVITQRDFCMVLHRRRCPRTRVSVCALRAATHPCAAPSPAMVRGETLGCVGFVVHPPADDGGAGGGAPHTRVIILSAADPKGSLPSALVNFVARRTPKMWATRLRAALALFAAERAAAADKAAAAAAAAAAQA